VSDILGLTKNFREEIVENILKKQKEAATKARMVQLRNE